MNKYEFVLLRTLTTQAAESAPVAATFTVRLQTAAPYTEFTLDGGSAAGSPTTITFKFWTLVGKVVTYIGYKDVALADIGAFVAPIYHTGADLVWCTVSFTGGSTPTVSGSLMARPVFTA